MTNPLNSTTGTIVSGLVLTAILFIFAKNFLGQQNTYSVCLEPAVLTKTERGARIALLASRTNTMLSIPMLFFMISGSPAHTSGIFG